MRLIRFIGPDGGTRFGAQIDDGSAEALSGSVAEGFSRTGETVRVVKLLAPIEPAAIFCIGLNYRFHAEESGAKIPERPILFFKSPAAIQNPGDPIEIPRCLRSEEVDYECELAVVIGKAAKNVSREHALEHVLGYTCANDVSARDWQIKYGGGQWCRGKTFDTFCPLGPAIVTTDELPNAGELGIRTVLNGQAVQDWNTNDMIFDVASLIEFLSGSTTLPAGSVILTGTPQGVGMAHKPPLFLKAGDVVSIEIDGIGALTNPVVEERC